MFSGAHIHRILVRVILGIFAVLYVGGVPGSTLRPLVLELTAAPLPETVADRDGVLDVVVTDGVTKGPFVGARVRAFAILEGRAHAAGEAKSDAEGRATLTALPRAEHWIVAEATGRARASQMVVIVAGPRRLDMELVAEHVLDVVVKTEGGAPIEGAEIEARGADPFPVGARTDGEGRAHVGRLSGGPFTVLVRAPGFEEVTRRRVPEGETLVVVLGKNGALLVKVVEEDGSAVAGARVLVASASLWPARSADTGKDGTVRIGGLEQGSYTLRSVHHTRVSPVEIGLPLAKGEEKVVELRLQAGVMVTAHVVDATNDDDLAKARVTLAEGGLSTFPLEGVTDKKGRVVLGPIARGPASLSARADGYVAKGAVSIDETTVSEVVVRMVRGGTLVGRITDARGYAVDGATLRVVGTDLDGQPVDEEPRTKSFREAHFNAALAGPKPLVAAGELGVVPGPVPPIPHGPALGLSVVSGPTGPSIEGDPWVSGRDGRFEIKPVTPGRVRLVVRHPQYVEALSDVVTLASDKEAKIDVVLSRGGTLEGKVLDAKGRPLANAQVTILATKGSLERTTKTGTDGSFAFASVPEAMSVLVSRDEDLSRVAARTEIQVPEGTKRTIEITVPEPRPSLPVKVNAGRGAKVEGVQVSVVSLDPAEGLRTTIFTDARGEGEIVGGRGLPLRVEVHAPGHANKVIVTTPADERLVIELTTAETLKGEVWANRREAIDGAEITLVTESSTRRVRSNKDGAFVIGDLAPGPARLRFRAKGRVPAVKDVTIAERGGRGETTIPRVELAEEGVVEGVVLDERGDPIAGARVAKDAVPTYLPQAGGLQGMASTDARGRFHLGELPEGNTILEAYAPDVGRGRATGVRVIAGRTETGVKIVITKDANATREPIATGGVAITLGETVAGHEPSEVVVVAVSEGSEAERAGLAIGDVLMEVGGTHPKTIGDARARLSGPVHDDVVVKLRRGERALTLRVAREAVRR